MGEPGHAASGQRDTSMEWQQRGVACRGATWDSPSRLPKGVYRSGNLFPSHKRYNAFTLRERHHAGSGR
jgi:hypothetical protein